MIGVGVQPINIFDKIYQDFFRFVQQLSFWFMHLFVWRCFDRLDLLDIVRPQLGQM